MKHTPEPWQYNPHTQRIWSETSENPDYKGNDAVIAEARDWHISFLEAEANAYRIVECVNACAGIEDPAAEIEYLKHAKQELEKKWDMVKMLELDAYHTLKEKTDKLLEALNFCKSVIQSGGMFERSEQLAVKQATEAINLLIS